MCCLINVLIIIIVIIIIILFCLLIYRLIINNKYDLSNSQQYNSQSNKYIDNDKQYYNNILIGGNDKFELPKRFPQVGVLTNKIFNTYSLDDFVWLEKTDGEHINLLIYDKELYYVNYGNKELLKNKYNNNILINTIDNIKESLPETISLLDCELYNDKLYIFDACIIDNIYIDELNFIERMNKVKDFINNNNLNKLFIIKEYYKIDKNNFKDLLDYIYNTDISKYTNNYVDGAIFQLINKPYFNKIPISYKLKKRCLNTIDFLLKYDKDRDIFLLFLSGDKYDKYYNTQYLIHKYNNKSNLNNDNKYENILFSSPLYENIHYYKVSNEWNKKGYSNRMIQEINNIIGDINNNKDKYNNTIIEMSLTEDNKWVPMRVRKDKRYPNGYKVGLSNCGIMFSPISTDLSYFNKDMSTSPFTEQTRSDYHDINKIVRKYIIKTIFKNYNTLINNNKHDKNNIGYNMLLDLCGGRGGDINNIINESNNIIDNFFIVDADKPSIVQYTERMDPHKFINNNLKIRFVKGFHHVLNDNEQDTNKLINDIKSSPNYIDKEGFSIILMNYAIHYISNKRSSLLQLKKIVKELLKHNGIFAFTYFDGDKILNSLTKYKKLMSFDEKIINETFKDIKLINKYNDSDSDSINCLMALPTIDAKGYREEPLVFQNFLNVLEDDILKFKTFIYPVQDLIKNNELEHNDITNYLEYVKLCIMIKQ